MAGHSKWNNIKRQKAREDKRRGKLFAKLVREITVAAREKGGDPEYNPRLRLAIEKAKDANMPQENIENAIKRGTGELEGVDYQEVTYEGYGPGGVALFIEATTDNPNRTVQELRHVLDTYGGNLGTDGSVAWQFDQKGQIYVSGERYTEHSVLEAALEAGAEDVSSTSEEFVITTDVESFHRVQEKVRSAGVEFSEADLAWLPRNTVPVDRSNAGLLLKLLDEMEELDDVQDVYANADIDHDVLAETA